jgi:hypothetical protein
MVENICSYFCGLQVNEFAPKSMCVCVCVCVCVQYNNTQ